MKHFVNTQHLTMAALVCLGLISIFVPQHIAKAAEPELRLEKGNHIAYIGNTLADRMQHDGWLETYLQTLHPGHELTFRNLGFAGDEVAQRQRSQNFGDPNQWLTKCEADVVFCFFGYNEALRGPAELPKFETELAKMIQGMRSQKYNGTSPPQLVVISPIAHENLHNRHLPDGTKNNEKLDLYTKAMRRVCGEQCVRFVDLFTPTLALYSEQTEPLTINGIHLNKHGNRLIAKAIGNALFGPSTSDEAGTIAQLQPAVADKNFHWYQRYRVVDGYNVYGGRSKLRYKPRSSADDPQARGRTRYADGISNRVVMDREMEVLDTMTANRDARVWAVAQGSDLTVDDGNTEPFIDVPTNLPGRGPDGTHLFLSGQEALAKMTVADGLKVTLFADEQSFPDLINPVQMSFDTKGRLWVATWPTYPHWKPKNPMNDKLLILEDTNHDGKADKAKVFADGLHCITGFEFWNGGVLLAQAPYIVFLKDTDGDDKADTYVRMLSSIDSADTHHTANSFTFGPGGGHLSAGRLPPECAAGRSHELPLGFLSPGRDGGRPGSRQGPLARKPSRRSVSPEGIEEPDCPPGAVGVDGVNSGGLGLRGNDKDFLVIPHFELINFDIDDDYTISVWIKAPIRQDIGFPKIFTKTYVDNSQAHPFNLFHVADFWDDTIGAGAGGWTAKDAAGSIGLTLRDDGIGDAGNRFQPLTTQSVGEANDGAYRLYTFVKRGNQVEV
ncbi:MAG: hypothetical protein IH899_10860, partial [Planctomycetes bacterium]|nr:hypothetical protein [Planctomycetota bacterium]